MRHTREIVRHKWILKLGHRAVRDALGTSHGTITATLKRAHRVGLDWPAVNADAQLEALLYRPPPSVGTPRPEPDWPRLELQLRKKGVPLELLHQEYLGV